MDFIASGLIVGLAALLWGRREAIFAGFPEVESVAEGSPQPHLQSGLPNLKLNAITENFIDVEGRVVE